MPVSTRSKNLHTTQAQTDTRNRPPKKDENHELINRNPHHGLKEKMKALTLLYEQQKQIQKEPRFSTHPSVDLLGSCRKDENNRKSRLSNVIKEIKVSNFANGSNYLPAPQVVRDEFKENVEFSCGERVNVVKKLNVQEGEKIRGRESRILVFVRLRPMWKKERDLGSKCCVRIVNKRDVYLTELANENENDYLRLKRLRGRHFTFDASFPDSTTQQEIYSTTTAELVEAVLQGRNGSVFCYGATGAGKTYTMLGTTENPGVMVLAIKDLFNKIRQKSFDGHSVVHLSYLEVYNETVRDLLAPGRPLVLREDKQGIVAAGLTQYKASSTNEVMALLQQGNLNRTTEPTRANETSSRSHAILQVAVEYKVRDASNNILCRVGKLSLIDLAGSERALATDQRTLRSLEGANINKSLLALSSCINALVEGKKHIPFRNSKLTQLLKDSLGGCCNTVMIANISPNNLVFGETQNTLHWADRAKEIRMKGSNVNEEIQVLDTSSSEEQAKLLLELEKENRELRMELAKQKLLVIQAQTIAASPTPSSVSSFLYPTPSSSKKNEKHKPRPSFNCFTPESKKKTFVKDLTITLKAHEAEIGRIKKEYERKMKVKDDYICELSKKNTELGRGVVHEGIFTRSRARLKEPPQKTPIGKPVATPAQPTKKRSFWDITAANSPSVDRATGRKTRSQFKAEAAPPPPPVRSLLLQPGFARQRTDTMKK